MRENVRLSKCKSNDGEPYCTNYYIVVGKTLDFIGTRLYRRVETSQTLIFFVRFARLLRSQHTHVQNKNFKLNAHLKKKDYMLSQPVFTGIYLNANIQLVRTRSTI